MIIQIAVDGYYIERRADLRESQRILSTLRVIR